MPSPLLSLLPRSTASTLEDEAAAAGLTPEAYANCLAMSVSGITFWEIMANTLDDIRAEARAKA